jgi:hypothetical protein
MKPYVGAGWYIWHITDRNVELRKDSPVYRRFCNGKDGYVKKAVEPGMTRAECLEEAIKRALQMDEMLAYRVAKELIPTASAYQTYEMKAHRLNKVFKTPEDASVIGRKRP